MNPADIPPDLDAPIPRNQTILLTGGAGFIGAALVERLVELNKVVVLDIVFDGQPLSHSSAANHPNLERVQGSVLDRDVLMQVAADADIIVHMAAIVGVRRVLSDARGTLLTNFQGTANTIEAAAAASHLKRFVYFSTSEVFGMNSFRVSEMMPSSIGPITEARWSYSTAKLAGEHLLAAFHRESGLPSVIVRPFNVFGAGRTGDHAMLRFIVAALKGEDLIVHGSGNQIRSWCYIDDFCDGVLRTLSIDAAIGEDFNLGNARNTLTIYMLARQVISLLNSKSHIRFENISFADIDIRVPVLDKAERLLGYRPRVEMDEAIVRAADWYSRNLHLVEHVSA